MLLLMQFHHLISYSHTNRTIIHNSSLPEFSRHRSTNESDGAAFLTASIQLPEIRYAAVVVAKDDDEDGEPEKVIYRKPRRIGSVLIYNTNESKKMRYFSYFQYRNSTQPTPSTTCSDFQG